MLTKGAKTSEFYVVLAVVMAWIAQYLGVDLSPDQLQTGAVEVAKQLHGLQSDNSGIWLAGGYALARTVLKWREYGVK